MHIVRPRHRRAHVLASIGLAAITALALSACGSDEPADTSPSTTAPSADTGSPSTDEPSDPPSSSATPDDTGADVEVEVTVAGDTVTTASDRVDVEVGQTVRITVTSDVAEEVHVHGFDLSVDLEPGEPGELEFEVTDNPGPGLYEVELEESGLLLFQLEVR
jgi:hypothetical protein